MLRILGFRAEEQFVVGLQVWEGLGFGCLVGRGSLKGLQLRLFCMCSIGVILTDVNARLLVFS